LEGCGDWSPERIRTRRGYVPIDLGEAKAESADFIIWYPRQHGLKPHTSVLLDYFMLLLLLLLCGTRRTETARSRWSDIRLEDDMVMLAAETTKSGKMAAVPLGP
jgi:integrase